MDYSQPASCRKRELLAAAGAHTLSACAGGFVDEAFTTAGAVHVQRYRPSPSSPEQKTNGDRARNKRDNHPSRIDAHRNSHAFRLRVSPFNSGPIGTERTPKLGASLRPRTGMVNVLEIGVGRWQSLSATSPSSRCSRGAGGWGRVFEPSACVERRSINCGCPGTPA